MLKAEARIPIAGMAAQIEQTCLLLGLNDMPIHILTAAPQIDKTPSRAPAKKVSKLPSLLCVASKHQDTSDKTTPPLQSAICCSSLLDLTETTGQSHAVTVQETSDASRVPGHKAISRTTRHPHCTVGFCAQHNRPRDDQAVLLPQIGQRNKTYLTYGTDHSHWSPPHQLQGNSSPMVRADRSHLISVISVKFQSKVTCATCTCPSVNLHKQDHRVCV